MLKSAHELKALKGKERLAFLTCYDYQMALWMNKTPLDAVLVGDSLAQVLYGLEHTNHISVDAMVLHTEAVRKGLPDLHLIADMPYLKGRGLQLDDPESKPEDFTKESLEAALEIAMRFMDAGANSIKLENPRSEVVSMLIDAGISVCGHIGLTPQTIHEFKRQGRDTESAQKIITHAQRLDELGCYAMVLEAVPRNLAKEITQVVSALTIGIAAGADCDAQILVHYDLLGLTYEAKKFVTPHAELGQELRRAVEQYAKLVKAESR